MEQEEAGVSALLAKLVPFKVPLLLLFVAAFFILVGLRVFTYHENQKNLVTIVESDEASGSGELVVYIAGSIEKPGVYKVASGSRIADLLTQAGGLTEAADKVWVEKNINLAQKLLDGGKIYIPAIAEGKTVEMSSVLSAETETMGSTVNINSASSRQLEGLAGIGEVTAGKIIAARPYQSIEELISKKVVGKSVFEKIKEQISI